MLRKLCGFFVPLGLCGINDHENRPQRLKDTKFHKGNNVWVYLCVISVNWTYAKIAKL